METTFARQTILPPPPSASRSLVAFLYAHRARISGLVREGLDRLVRNLRTAPALPSSASELPSASDWAETEPKVAAMPTALRSAQPGSLQPYRHLSATNLRQSAATAVELRRAG